MNITTVKGFETFLGSLKARSSHGHSTGVDLILSCVDNYEARMVVNQVKTSERRTFMILRNTSSTLSTFLIVYFTCIVVYFCHSVVHYWFLYPLFRLAMNFVRHGWNLVSLKLSFNDY